MGRNFATAMNESGLRLKSQISLHLSANHYPPVPQTMVQPCIDAINACKTNKPNTLVTLPAGVTWQDKNEAPAWAIVQGHHLQEWI